MRFSWALPNQNKKEKRKKTRKKWKDEEEEAVECIIEVAVNHELSMRTYYITN